jgi:diaminohydroxyphosphoribosylaminopyrimidine deaminase/5-amino-6-(5-phosphoribosylamino)uracil reductase
MFDAFDHQCMAQALRLAELGMNSTDPNPRVGCVLTRDREVVGTGWHRRAGEPHAEVFALREAGESARGATAYVTLEPCSHQGRTPACTEALIEAGVARVVFPVNDANPEINGNGKERLREAGIRVDVGLMKEQAEELNPGFFSRMRRKRPWVRVKLAQSLDGGTALANGASQWISCPESRQDVQNWRARSSAILTGIGTVLFDNPSLNVRIGEDARQPLRVIADSNWRTPADARTLGLPGEVLIGGRDDIEVPVSLRESGATLLPLPAEDGRVRLESLLEALAAREANEVHVEAGASLAGALLERRLVDELVVYQAPVLLGSEIREPFAFGPLQDMADRVSLEWLETCHTGNDLRLRLAPRYGKN